MLYVLIILFGYALANAQFIIAARKILPNLIKPIVDESTKNAYESGKMVGYKEGYVDAAKKYRNSVDDDIEKYKEGQFIS